VLGALIRRRGSAYGYGYELRDQLMELTEALGYSDTIVYASLAALVRDGSVRVVEPENVSKRSRQAETRVYHEVTEVGERRFRAWMDSMPAKAPPREDVYQQLVAAQPEDVPHLIDAMRAFEDQCREQLRRLIERPLGRHAARSGTPGMALVQEGLLTHFQGMLEWAQRCVVSLSNLDAQSTGVPGRRRP
jgi:DNA-binding PadR family transcriptional regulator